MLPPIPFIGDSDAPEKQTYVDLRPQPALQIPADLKQSESGQVSVVPEIGMQRNASFYPDRPPLPDAKYVTDNRNEVRMQRLGDRIYGWSFPDTLRLRPKDEAVFCGQWHCAC